MENFLEIFSFVIIIAVAYALGTIVETDHYSSIQKREKQFLNMPAVNAKIIESENVSEGRLVYGSVVISQDYFKRFLAGLHNIVGGRVVSYETLFDRARREAILRMKEKAHVWGADLILNTRFETSSVGDEMGKLGCFEILAYGTAVRLKSKPA